MNLFFELLILISISILFTVLYEWIKKSVPSLCHEQQQNVSHYAIFVGLFTVLLLTFTISNYLTRYNNYIDLVKQDTSQLGVTIRILKDLDDTQPILDNIQKYVNYLSQDGTNPEIIYELYSNINKGLINYVKTNQNNFNTDLLSRLKGNEAILETIALDNTTNNFLYVLTVFFSLITLYIFLFIKISTRWIQYTLDFCVMSVFVCSLYIIYKLNSNYLNINREKSSPYKILQRILTE